MSKTAASWTIRVNPAHTIPERFAAIRKPGETASGAMDRIFRAAEAGPAATPAQGSPDIAGALERIESRLEHIAAAHHPVTNAVSRAAGNPEHQRLFALPVSTSTALVEARPLPEQERVTGDLEIDAYLWLQAICKTTTSLAELERAEQAAARLATPVNELGKRYADHLIAQGAQPFQAAFGSLFSEIADLAEKARERIAVNREGLALFGSYSQALEPTAPEQMLERTAGKLPKGNHWEWTPKQQAKLFAKSVNPSTLTEVAAELRYWSWLGTLRWKMAETEGEHQPDDGELIDARRWWLESLLSEMPPQSRDEALHIVSEVKAGLVDIGSTDDAKRHAEIFEHLLRWALGG